MFATLFSVTLFFLVAARAVLADFTIVTPELVQCQKAAVSWAASVAPYNLVVVPADDPCGDSLVDLGDHNVTSLHWTVNIPAGTQVVFSVLDATEDEAWSGEITIKASNDSSCLPAASSATPASSSRTTLIVANTAAGVSPTSGAAVPAGAANAGTNPLNSAALSVSQLPAAATLLSAFAAIVVAITL